MNHFNSTVQDGKLINTRRGLQVSRQKFHGISFVNSCPQTYPPSTEAPNVPNHIASSSHRPIRFVEGEDEPRQQISRAGRQTAEQINATPIPEAPQGRKQRRKAALKDQSKGKPRGSTRAFFLGSSSGECTSSFAPVIHPQGRYFQSQEHFSLPTPRPINLAPSRPSYLSREDWQLFHLYWTDIARKLFPYEDIMTDNPARSSEFYWVTVGGSDMCSLHCVLMSGSISQAAINSEVDPKGYSYHISKMCAILKRDLDEGKPVGSVTLSCIASLATSACYVGQLGDWWMHMGGLRNILDIRDPIDLSHPMTSSTIHRAGLRGAAALAITPLIPFNKTYPLVSLILPSTIRSYITSSISYLLGPLLPLFSLTPASLTSLSLLASAVRLASQSAGAVSYDAYALTDEWLSVTYDLLAKPAPLREIEVGENPFVGGRTNDMSGMSTAETYMANHRLYENAHIVPAAGTHDLEAALRIAGLLYLKELLPDWPRNIGGYAVLLTLLQYHLESIMREGLTDPALHAQKDRESAVSRVDSSSQRKATLIFLCLMGNTACLFGNENEGRYEKGDPYPRDVYQRCLRNVLGVEGNCEGAQMRIEDLVQEEDLLLLKVLDMRNIKGEDWDDRVAMQELLVEEL